MIKVRLADKFSSCTSCSEREAERVDVVIGGNHATVITLCTPCVKLSIKELLEVLQ